MKETKFKLKYESPRIQIYEETGKFKDDERYEYIYRFSNPNITEIQVYKSFQFPYNLMSVSTGFLFVHSTKNGDAAIPTLPDEEYKDYKTNLKCLSNGFINRDINVVMKLRPAKYCHPNCVKDFVVGLNISPKSSSELNKKELFKHFKSLQPKFKNAKEWKKYIYENCPTHIHFAKGIDDSTFEKGVSESDMAVDYDIHDVNEFEIVKMVEKEFENMNQLVKIFDNYNNIVSRIQKACDEHKINYSTSEESKYKKLKYKGKVRNQRINGVKWIELKYSDLIKLGLEYKLSDFIS